MVYIEYGEGYDMQKTSPMTLAKAKKIIESYKEQYWVANIKDCSTHEIIYTD